MRTWKATAIGAEFIARITQQGSIAWRTLVTSGNKFYQSHAPLVESMQTTRLKQSLGAGSPIGRAVFRSDVRLSAAAFA
jgi:hypothetical protein